MALRAGYYGIKRFLRDKLETIAGTYDETIKSLFPRSEQVVLGAKNLLGSKPSNINVENSTINADGSITLSGAISADILVRLSARTNADAVILKKDKTYIVTIQNGIDGVAIQVGYTNPSTGTYTSVAQSALGANALEFTNPVENAKYTIQLTRGSASTTTMTETTIYPMLRLASDPDDTYVPYAMTNRELTDSAADQKTAINAIITAATGAADYAAFKTAMGAITPVTRSLSLTKEDIIEEVKEDVEPEKTVTKKRTTKKTEEV